MHVVRNGILVTAVAGLLVGGSAWAQAPSGKQELHIEAQDVSDVAAIPESIDVDESTHSYFTAATVDGTIYRGSIDRPDLPAEVWLGPGTDGRLSGQGVTIDDERRLLFVATGPAGLVDVYDLDTKALVGQHGTGAGGYLNDVAVTPSGDLYVTDSVRTTLYRVPAGEVRSRSAPAMVPIPQDGPFTYSLTSNDQVEPNAAFNAGGIVALSDDQLVITQINEGRLFRFNLAADRASAQITEIATDRPLDNLDGLEVSGSTLWTTDNLTDQVNTLELAADRGSARVTQETSEPNFCTPTAVALVEGDDRLLVLNAQLFRPTGTPYTVSSLPLPLDGTVDDNPDRGMTLVPCQRDLPGAPAGAPVEGGGATTPAPASGPATTAAPSAPRSAARLRLVRARVTRAGRLQVRATLTSRAVGQTVRITLRGAGRTTRATATVRRAGDRGQVRLTRRLPAAQRKAGGGVLTLSYRGSNRVRAQTVQRRLVRVR